ncbi:MAG: DUF805 domain-containing protein [Rhodobacteraceae bacterium]|nr:DUF805 domain-containing protein [Paracoccaceae bacterium]
MSPVSAVKDGFVKAFTFSGRSRRPEYWWFFGFVFVGAAVIGALESAAFGAPGRVVRFFQILVFLPFLAVGWRRLQDTGRPGWYLLVPVAVVMASWFLIGSAPRHVLPEGAILAPAPGQGLGAGFSPTVLAGATVAQVLAGVVIVWWMIRPSQRGANAFGPEPRVR